MYLHLTNAESRLIGINPNTPKSDDSYAFWLRSFILSILQKTKTGYLKKSPCCLRLLPFGRNAEQAEAEWFPYWAGGINLLL